MTVTSGVSGCLVRVSSAVSPKRFSVSPGVSASRGNSYQESSGNFLREKEERDQTDPQSSIPRARALRGVSSGAFHGSRNAFRLRAFRAQSRLPGSATGS